MAAPRPRRTRPDVERIPREAREESVERAVLGTAVHEPILLALRRIAHRELGIAHYKRRDGEDREHSKDDEPG